MSNPNQPCKSPNETTRPIENLYLLHTKGLGTFYVLSETSTDAENKLGRLLRDCDYGFYDDRLVTRIDVITSEIFDLRFDLSNKNKRLVK